MNQCRRVSLLKRFSGGAAFGGFALCALCCALPLIGTLIGAGSLVAIALSLEWVAVGLIAMAILLCVWAMVRRRQASRCDLDCECRPTPQ